MRDFDNIAAQLREGSKNLLSHKESIVAAYLIMDYNVQEITVELCRAITTIKTHISSMKRKCNCRTYTKLGAILQSFLKNSPLDYIQANHSSSYFIKQPQKMIIH